MFTCTCISVSLKNLGKAQCKITKLEGEKLNNKDENRVNDKHVVEIAPM